MLLLSFVTKASARRKSGTLEAILIETPDFADQDKPVQRWFLSARSWLNREDEALASHDGLSTGWQFVAFGLVIVALFCRSPRLLTHAQFYAEDGTIWFAQAYNNGWLYSLTLPQAGYLNSMPRLAAGLALLVPLTWAPLVMVTAGLFAQALPVPILLSARSRNLASLPTRMLLAALYVALPNAREIHLVATNTQWHLALTAALVAFACSPQTWRGRLFDIVVLLVASLTGPYCIVLAPVVLLFWWARRQPWSLVVFALVSAVACAQIAVLTHSTHRVQGALGATPAGFLRMLGGHVVACALVGSYSFASLAPMTFIVPAALGGLGICLYCLRFANLEWKLFLIYCGGVFAACLHSPLTPGNKPAWDWLIVDNSARYWFFPMLAFVWSAVWCAVYGRDRLFKIAGTCILLIMSVGIIRDWNYGPYPDDHFALSVVRMREAKPGERVVIPVVPDGWHMDLVKKSL
jgi:hypothetical protein